MEFWGTFLTSTAFGSTAGALVVYLSKSVIGTRIEESIRHEYATKLSQLNSEMEHQNQLAIERLKSEFITLQSSQATALSVLSEGQKQTHARTLDAIHTLWSEIMAIKLNMPWVVYLVNVLTNEEYVTFMLRDDLRKQVEDFVQSDWPRATRENEEDFQNARLFAGNDLYATFFSYRQILLRIKVQFESRLEKNLPESWYEERGMVSILKAIFSEVELQHIEENEVDTLRKALEVLEFRFLEKAKDIVYGKDAAMQAITSGREILSQLAELEAKNDREKAEIKNGE